MPPDIQNVTVKDKPLLAPLTTVTPLSKYLALALFVIIPIVTLYVGTQYAPIRYVEIEKVVYRDAPQVPAQNPVNSVATTGQQIALNIGLRSVELTNSNGNPESDIYVGDTLVLRASGGCNFKSGARSDLFSYRQMLKPLINDIIQIRESGTCWLAGGGSEFYVVTQGESVQLVGLKIWECGNLPINECSGFGVPEVLYEIDTAGVVTKQYKGGLYSG